MNGIPQMMRVETTNICNEACRFCPYPELERPKGKMDEGLYVKLLKEHSGAHTEPRLLFPANVGEPFLDKRLPEWIGLASREYGYRHIASFTNATMLNEDLAAQVIKQGLTEIMFTLHGLKEDSFSEITGFANYDLVKHNIKRFIEINEMFGRRVKIFFDIYSEYSAEESLADELVQLAVSSGVHLTLESLENTHNWGGKKAEAQEVRASGCKRLYSQFAVLHDGLVSACCVDTEGEGLYGNATHQSLQEIFAGPRRLGHLRKEREGRLAELALCRYCNLDCHKKVEPVLVHQGVNGGCYGICRISRSRQGAVRYRRNSRYPGTVRRFLGGGPDGGSRVMRK